MLRKSQCQLLMSAYDLQGTTQKDKETNHDKKNSARLITLWFKDNPLCIHMSWQGKWNQQITCIDMHAGQIRIHFKRLLFHLISLCKCEYWSSVLGCQSRTTTYARWQYVAVNWHIHNELIYSVSLCPHQHLPPKKTEDELTDIQLQAFMFLKDTNLICDITLKSLWFIQY